MHTEPLAARNVRKPSSRAHQSRGRTAALPHVVHESSDPDGRREGGARAKRCAVRRVALTVSAPICMQQAHRAHCDAANAKVWLRPARTGTGWVTFGGLCRISAARHQCAGRRRGVPWSRQCNARAQLQLPGAGTGRACSPCDARGSPAQGRVTRASVGGQQANPKVTRARLARGSGEPLSSEHPIDLLEATVSAQHRALLRLGSGR